MNKLLTTAALMALVLVSACDRGDRSSATGSTYSSPSANQSASAPMGRASSP